MNEEINTLEKDGTWEIVERQGGNHPVGCMWIYTVKHKSDGTLNHYMAKIMAK